MQKRSTLTLIMLNVSIIVSSISHGQGHAQIVQPIAPQTIQKTGDALEAFSLGMGVGIANYMCFEALKGHLDPTTGNNILGLYTQWFDQQTTYQRKPFMTGFNLEVRQFNQAFPVNPCPYSLP